MANQIEKPKVYFLAETNITSPAIIDENLNSYLSEIGAEEWETDAQSDAEYLIEASGRMCYRSWKPGLNKNVTKVREGNQSYLENVIKSGHGSVLEHGSVTFLFHNVSRVFCYDDETEVLTKSGWVKWPDVKGNEFFATLNPDTNEIEYQKADEVVHTPYNGMMYKVKNEQVDLLVTPNHRMWAQKVDTQEAKRKEEKYAIYQPDEIFNKRVKYTKVGKWNFPKSEYFEIGGIKYKSESFVKFLGWYLTEGHLVADRNCVSISQNINEHYDIIDALKEISIDSQYNPRSYSYDSTKSAQICLTIDKSLYEFLKELGKGAKEKHLPEDFVYSISSELASLFLQCCVAGNGFTHTGHKAIYTTSKLFADQLQVLAIKSGISANIRIDDRVGLKRVVKTGQKFYNKNVCYIVSLITKRNQPMVNHGVKSEYQDSYVPYNGMVHCVRVPNGLLWVRRNGKPVVSGNTHELVRHRVGTAFSQESLRYVRLDDIKYWLPKSTLDELEKNMSKEKRSEVESLMKDTFDHLEEVQKKLGNLIDDNKMPFALKKKLTSMFRRVAPIGLSTGIIFTTNHRNLRHVIEMRTSRHAEEEIRSVFQDVAEICVNYFPNIYFDFDKTLVDGYYEYKPENRNV